jgi:hypothetical protein
VVGGTRRGAATWVMMIQYARANVLVGGA